MSKDYIIQKAVELSKVVKKRRKTLEELGNEYMAFRKYDGCCAILKDGHTYSRTGELYQSLDDLAEFLQAEFPDWVFIGEAWWPGPDQFNLISGEFRRHARSSRLTFRVHDCIPREDFDAGECDIEFVSRSPDNWVGEYMQGRIADATGWGKGKYGHPQAKCNELTDIGGYDGLILRDPKGKWKVGSGTTGEIIKVKRKLSFDLRVTEVNTAVGEKTGRTVYKLVVDFKGKSLGVGSGLPHDPDKVPKVGDIVEVEAMDYSSDGLLREPRFKGVRFDKVEPDA